MRLTVTYGLAEYKSKDYDTILKLRKDVMRKPIGLDFTEKDTIHDAENLHVWLRVNGKIVGTAMLAPDKNCVVYLHMVAMLPQARGFGFAARMIRYCEGIASGLGYTEIKLDSREKAIGFYENLGYKSHGEFFEQVGIPHIFMNKELV